MKYCRNKLNKNKYQKIRVFTKSNSWDLIDFKDFTIIKNYITEEEINIDKIIFNWVSESIKIKIEKIKLKIASFPKEFKLKGLQYIQKLQEEWQDNREKTNIILEFEWFIINANLSNKEELINLLESLLVDDQEDKSEKAITFNALENLIPKSISCINSAYIVDNKDSKKYINCYDNIILLLESIRDNSDLNKNKVFWKEILKAVWDDKIMTNKEKIDFKAILKTFVYWWIWNIPKEEVKEIIKKQNNKWSSKSNFLLLFWNILLWFLLLYFMIYIYYYFIFYLL